MRALALLMFVAATLPMTFVRPIVGLMLWIWFSYMNPHRIAYGFATGFPWVMICAVLTIMAATVHADQRQRLHMKPVIVLMTLFLLWTGVTTLTAIEPDMASAQWIRFFKILLMAYATLILVTDKQRLHWVLWTVVLSFGFWGFKGGLFTLLTGGGYHVLGPHKSFFFDNNDFALVMCMTLPLMRYFQLHESRQWVRYGLWVLMGLTVVSILGTYSRGGFLALGAVGFMMMLKSRRRMGLIVVLPLLALAAASFMPQQWVARIHSIRNYHQNTSAQGRIQSWRFATKVAIAKPIVAGGFDVWASDSMWDEYGPPGATHRAIHSIFFEVLGEHGFIGLALFLGLLGSGWLSLSRIRKQARAGPAETAWMGDLASMMQVSLAGFIAAGTFLPMPYFDLFYQLLAFTAVLQVMIKQGAGESVAGSGRSRKAVNRTKPTSVPAAARRRKPLSLASRGGVQELPPW